MSPDRDDRARTQADFDGISLIGAALAGGAPVFTKARIGASAFFMTV